MREFPEMDVTGVPFRQPNAFQHCHHGGAGKPERPVVCGLSASVPLPVCFACGVVSRFPLSLRVSLLLFSSLSLFPLPFLSLPVPVSLVGWCVSDKLRWHCAAGIVSRHPWKDPSMGRGCLVCWALTAGDRVVFRALSGR